MPKKVGELIFQRFELNRRKTVILSKHPILPKNHKKLLHKIIQKEIGINEKLIWSIFKQKRSVDYYLYHEPIMGLLIEINELLHIEKKYLKSRKSKTYLIEIERKENTLNSILFEYTQKFQQIHHLDASQFRKEIILLRQIQKEAHNISSHIGNSAYVQKHSKRLIALTEKTKESGLYGYVQQDIDWIKKRAKDAIKDPKNNKLKYAFATFYIVSPGTFELTGVLLFFRYVGKYSIKTHKKIKKKIKNNNQS